MTIAAPIAIAITILQFQATRNDGAVEFFLKKSTKQ
jgi:hypothetical protein